jgi:hypothetical protein
VFDRGHRPPDLADRGTSRAVSDVEGEKASPTQPFPTKPAAFAPQGSRSTTPSISR